MIPYGYTLSREWLAGDPERSWWLEVRLPGGPLYYLIQQQGELWFGHQPGRIVAVAVSRGRAVTHILRDLMTKESV